MMPALSPTVHGPGEYGSLLAQQAAAEAGGAGSGSEGPGVGSPESGHDIFPMSPDAASRATQVRAAGFGQRGTVRAPLRGECQLGRRRSACSCVLSSGRPLPRSLARRRWAPMRSAVSVSSEPWVGC